MGARIKKRFISLFLIYINFHMFYIPTLKKNVNIFEVFFEILKKKNNKKKFSKFMKKQNL
jgi:hypothetical protein